jgi:hypothetical protein
MKQHLLLCLALAIGCGNLFAQDFGRCSNSTLEGTYAVQLTGTAPAPVVLPDSGATPGTIQPFVGLALITFDGYGSFTQFDYIKGTLSGYTPARPGKGTYKVNPDCTGTSTISLPVAPFEIVTQFIITDSGRSFVLIVTTPQTNMTAGTGRRVR